MVISMDELYFEVLLERKRMEIPCSSESEESDRRIGREAPIYVTEYGELCETIASIMDGYL